MISGKGVQTSTRIRFQEARVKMGLADPPSITGLIGEYLQIQDDLLRALGHVYPEIDWSFPINFPRAGSVCDSSGAKWSFQRHGAGVRFTRGDGLIVDPDRFLDGGWHAFNIHRVCDFLDSKGIRYYSYDDKVRTVDIESLKEVVESLLAKGSVQSVSGHPGMFVLADRPCDL